MPFDNGGGYYVHQYGSAPALTQEFTSPSGTKGSILKPLSGGSAYYVRDPIWSTYIQKQGPYDIGPGLPVGEEHPIASLTRRSCTGCQIYTYNQVSNFERGAILWNSYEGGITPSYDQHANLIANCAATGINDVTFGSYLQGMVGRFALGTDSDTKLGDPNSTNRYLGGYTDAECMYLLPLQGHR